MGRQGLRMAMLTKRCISDYALLLLPLVTEPSVPKTVVTPAAPLLPNTRRSLRSTRR